MAAHTVAHCNACGRPYHLNQRTDLPGEDCGAVWLSEAHLALEFACQPCLDLDERAARAADVLDADEAAALASLPSTAIVGAAEAGRLAHRRTGGGVYLFEREAVIAFALEQR